MAWFVIEAVAELDLSAFYAAYRADGWGGRGLRASSPPSTPQRDRRACYTVAVSVVSALIYVAVLLVASFVISGVLPPLPGGQEGSFNDVRRARHDARVPDDSPAGGSLGRTDVVRASAGRCRCASRDCECGGGACGSRDGDRVRGAAYQTRSAPRRGEGQRGHVPGCRMVPWLPCRAPGALPAQESADGLLPDGVPDARRSPLRRGCARDEDPQWTARRCDGRPV